jgi:hypothetical protein
MILSFLSCARVATFTNIHRTEIILGFRDTQFENVSINGKLRSQ